MIYIYYRVLIRPNVLVFECIYEKDDIHQRVYYNNQWWDLGNLHSHFIDLDYEIISIEFTTKELYNWLLQKDNNIN